MSLSSTGESTQVDADLVQWQKDAIDFDPFDPEDNDEGNLDGMTPMAMQLDFERRSAKFLKTVP